MLKKPFLTIFVPIGGLCLLALVLVRPDQHIAWRGQVAPDEPDALIARITGAAAASVKKEDAALPA